MIAIPALHYLSYDRKIPMEPVQKTIGRFFSRAFALPGYE